MRSWFDLPSLDLAGKEDEVGIKKAHQLVEMLIEEEVKAVIKGTKSEYWIGLTGACGPPTGGTSPWCPRCAGSTCRSPWPGPSRSPSRS